MERTIPTETAGGKTRLRYLDIARGIGIMLVIISHAHGLSSYLINFYIPIFFVISGFTYFYSAGDLRRTRQDGGGDEVFAVRDPVFEILSV